LPGGSLRRPDDPGLDRAGAAAELAGQRRHFRAIAGDKAQLQQSGPAAQASIMTSLAGQESFDRYVRLAGDDGESRRDEGKKSIDKHLFML
jgi:hypothetical protein